jgi:Fe-S cluster biogenesis protein NfuA
MSTETADTENETKELKERVTNFLRRNFPQIQMHGGSAAIQHLDPPKRARFRFNLVVLAQGAGFPQ